MLAERGSVVTTLPQSHVGAEGPWLVVARPGNPVIRLDTRCLDYVEPMERGLRIVADLFAMCLEIADGVSAIENLAARLSPYTRGMPISDDLVYQDARRRIWRLWEEADGASTHPSIRGSELLVGDVVVSASEHLINVGNASFLTSEVDAYAEVGADVPVLAHVGVPAALLMIPASIRERPIGADIMLLSKRIANYEASQDAGR